MLKQRFLFQFLLVLVVCSVGAIYMLTCSSRPVMDEEPLPTFATKANLSGGKYRLDMYNQSIHRFYVDVGCFNAQSIEQFIYFTPDSHLFDIFTFEPDPENYHLCKKRLEQEKFRNHNIFIIPRVVWIRNEKVLYQLNKGPFSRVETDENC